MAYKTSQYQVLGVMPEGKSESRLDGGNDLQRISILTYPVNGIKEEIWSGP